MERRYQCSIHVLLCDGGWDFWFDAAWKHLYVLAATVVVSCVQLHGVSQKSLRIHQFDSFGMFRPVYHYFSGHITTDTAKWSARNQRIFFFQLHVMAEKQQDEVDQVACWIPMCHSDFQEMRASVRNICLCSAVIKWKCVEFIHAATYREILQFS